MTANNGQSDQKKRDLLRRNAEMAESQSPEVTARIFRKGDRYYCAECNSELPIRTDCPGCHAHLDWDRIKAEMG